MKINSANIIVIGSRTVGIDPHLIFHRVAVMQVAVKLLFETCGSLDSNNETAGFQ